jgi:hypothetical protein
MRRASRQMIATSLNSCSDGGLRRPRDWWTMLIESSTVTNCSPVACRTDFHHA